MSGASDKALVRVRGDVGVAATKGGAVTPVTGSQIVADDQYAVTQAASNGLLTFPDSSEIGLGPFTTVQVGAFTQVNGTSGARITLAQGTMRFVVRRPAGAQSNYIFTTPTSSISVRGTIALVQAAANGDTIACLQCAAGDVAVTVGQQTIPLLTGQTLFVSLAGVITAGVVGTAVLQAFTGAGLSTTASASTSFAAGIGGSAAAAGGAAAGGVAVSAGAIAGVAAAAAGAAAIAGSTSSTTQSAASSQPTPAPTSTGTLQLTDSKRHPLAIPSPSATPSRGGHR